METLSGTIQNRIVGLQDIAPEQLTAHPQNFRRHPVGQRKALRASIERFGWAAPIIATTDGTVVDGHARVEEALSAGVKTVPVIVLDMDEQEAAELILRLDPISALATTDQEVLAELLTAATFTQDEQELTDALHALAAIPDNPPPLGDSWTLTIVCSDNDELEAVEAECVANGWTIK